MRFTALLLALGLALPTALFAQEEEDDDDAPPPTILMISYYQCPQSAIGGIMESYDANTRPFEEELVEEGMMAGAGLFVHWWADEWNVNYYRTGYDLNDMMEAINIAGQRAVEQNPDLADQPGPFAECTAHKDGIYTFGPGTDRPLPADDDDGN